MHLQRLSLILSACLLITTVPASADVCTFTTTGTIMVLDADCTTDVTIEVPDGMTLDGDGHIISVVDPEQGHFLGAVIRNGGAVAHVTNVEIQAGGLNNTCDEGADRLRGIMFEEASGSITHCTVMGLNQGASGCQEGNAIEVRAAPFDSSATGTYVVDVSHNNLYDWQKTGIVCNGDVDCTVEHNDIGSSATQEKLAANSVQVGFGATGRVFSNSIGGNQWKGTSDWGATAILVYDGGDGVEIDNNQIRGNSDIGIYFWANGGQIWNNKVFDEGDDHPNSGSDIGIGNWLFDELGASNDMDQNKVRGFDTPYDGEVGNHNIVIPDPQND